MNPWRTPAIAVFRPWPEQPPETRPANDCWTRFFGNSPYLTKICAGDPGFSCELLHSGPDAAFERIIGGLEGIRGKVSDRDRLASLLRTAKRRVALTVSLADITGTWSLKRVTLALSNFAEAALQLRVETCPAGRL